MSSGKNYFGAIWKKSYMLEIRSGEGSTFFTFSLPPESVEYTFPQRVSETKTFGGMFVDDYGPEAVRITFSGTTGNTELKKIYRNGASDLWLSGTQEIDYVRDEIIRYKQNMTANRKDYGTASLFLYNLASLADSTVVDQNAVPDAWEVILKDFRISKNKDRPFFSSYSIEFTGLRKVGEKRSDWTSHDPYSSTQQAVKPKLSDFEAFLAAIKDTYAASEGIRNSVRDMQRTLTSYKRELARYEAMITGTVDNLSVGLLNDVAFMAIDAYGAILGVASYPADLALSVVRGVDALRGQVESVIAAGNPLAAIGAKYTDVGIATLQALDGWAAVFNSSYATGVKNSTPAQVTRLSTQELGASNAQAEASRQTAAAVAAQDRSDAANAARQAAQDALTGATAFHTAAAAAYAAAVGTPSEAAAAIELANATSAMAAAQARYDQTVLDAAIAADAAAQAAAQAKAAQTVAKMAISSIPSGSAYYSITTYGTERTITATSTTTLEDLASRYFGNPDLAELIALYNGISGDRDIYPGLAIKIPILDDRAMNTANMVFSQNNRSGFGTDIRLDPGGTMLIAEHGDVTTVAEAENMNQAIMLRLSESLGNRVRLDMYGIKAAVGNANAVSNGYLAASVKDTVMQDPRISAISSLQMSGGNDSLGIAFDYVCNGETYHFAGVI